MTVNDDDDTNDESDAPYEIVFEHNTAATTCYGCKGRVREKPSAPLPPAPLIFSFVTKKEGYTTVLERPPSGSVQSQKWFTIIPYVLAVASTMTT